MHFPKSIFTLVFLAFWERSFAIICYKCDSITLAECATSLNSETLPTEECKNAYSCAWSIVDSVTYRGCTTKTPMGAIYYKTCPDSLCNKGVYPPGRLKCHQCSGANCIAEQVTKATPCVNFVEDDNCYIDVVDEIDTYRGCISDTVRVPGDTAYYCDVNGCNYLTAVSTLTCAKCDSNDARGCKMDLFEINNPACVITNKTTCTDVALLNHEQPSCFLYVNLGHVVRGCTRDSGMLSLDFEHFDTCYENLCNKQCLKRQKCIICDSKTNGLCLSDPSLLANATCESAEASSCFSCQLKDDSIQRGCGVPQNSPNAHCYECQGEGCNTSKFTKCYKCSSEESPNCGQWANPSIIDVEVCEIAGADCISAVLKNGKTLRGCQSSQLKCNDTQANCFSCSGNLCNDGVFPATRLQCHHCDGREKCSNIIDNSNVLPCAQYDTDDACFEFLSAKNTMVRGCRSDRDLYYECLLATQNGNQCRLCAGPACNMMPISRPASLTCHKCLRNDQSCNWFQGNETLEACQKPVRFLTMESCYTRRYLDGTVSRGCTLDESSVDKGDEFLEFTCMDDNCNGKSQIVQKCIECKGSVEEDNVCTTGVGTLTGVSCGNELLKFEERGCYTKIDGNFIERGCASNLSITELQSCQRNNGEVCYYCKGSECNTSSNITFILRRNSSSKMFPALDRSYFLFGFIVIYFLRQFTVNV